MNKIKYILLVFLIVPVVLLQGQVQSTCDCDTIIN